MSNVTVPSNIYIVTVENRVDGIYAFSDARQADRFEDAVLDNGGESYTTVVPLCITPDHTDDLIAAEKD